VQSGFTTTISLLLDLLQLAFTLDVGNRFFSDRWQLDHQILVYLLLLVLLDVWQLRFRIIDFELTLDSCYAETLLLVLLLLIPMLAYI